MRKNKHNKKTPQSPRMKLINQLRDLMIEAKFTIAAENLWIPFHESEESILRKINAHKQYIAECARKANKNKPLLVSASRRSALVFALSNK